MKMMELKVKYTEFSGKDGPITEKYHHY